MSFLAGGGFGGTPGGILVSAGTSSQSTGMIVFSNSNGVTFGLNASTITASVAAGGGGGSVNISAGTTSQNLTNFVISNSNNVSFGLNGSTVTASASFAQTVQTQNLVSIQGSTGNISFGNANGITFGGNASTLTASHNALTSQSNQAISAANGSFTFQTASFANSNGISFSSGTQGLYASHNGITSQTVQTQGSVQVQGSTGAISFANSNGITIGGNASTITLSHNGLTSQSNQAVSGANGSSTFQTLSFANSNGVSFSTGTQGLFASHNGITSQTVQTQNLVSLQGSTGAISFGNANGVTFGFNASTVTASHNGLTSQSNQALSGSNGSYTFQTATFGNLNGLSFYTSNGSMVGSYTVPTVPAQTNQTLGAYAVSNTTQSSSGTFDARSFSIQGAGGVSVGVSNGSVIISGATGGGGGLTNVNLSAGTTSNNLSNFVFSNLNGVSFGLDGSTVTASVAAGGGLSNVNISAGTTSNNLSNFVFSNANNISFGLNGSTVTASCSAAAGGGATLSMWPTQPEFWVMSNTVGAHTTNATTAQTSYSAWVFPMAIPAAVSANAMRLPVFLSATSATTTANFSFTGGLSFGLYTKNGASLSRLESFTNEMRLTYASATNSTAASATFQLTCGSGAATNSLSLSTNNAGNTSLWTRVTNSKLVPVMSQGYSISPGQYFGVLMQSFSTGGANLMQLISIGQYSQATQILLDIGQNQASTTAHYPFQGLVTLVGNGADPMPAFVATTAIRSASNNISFVNRMPYIQMVMSA